MHESGSSDAASWDASASDAAGGLPSHECSDDITHILWHDQDVEVLDFSRAERRMTSLAERLCGNTEAIEIRTQTALLRGVVLALCADFIVLGEAHREHLHTQVHTQVHAQVHAIVAHAAVLGIHGLPARIAAASDSLFRDNTRISSWLSCIEDRDIRLTMSGEVLHGHMLRVWADHFEVSVNHSTIVVPFMAVHSLQVLDDA